MPGAPPACWHACSAGCDSLCRLCRSPPPPRLRCFGCGFPGRTRLCLHRGSPLRLLRQRCPHPHPTPFRAFHPSPPLPSLPVNPSPPAPSPPTPPRPAPSPPTNRPPAARTGRDRPAGPAGRLGDPAPRVCRPAGLADAPGARARAAQVGAGPGRARCEGLDRGCLRGTQCGVCLCVCVFVGGVGGGGRAQGVAAPALAGAGSTHAHMLTPGSKPAASPPWPTSLSPPPWLPPPWLPPPWPRLHLACSIASVRTNTVTPQLAAALSSRWGRKHASRAHGKQRSRAPTAAAQTAPTTAHTGPRPSCLCGGAASGPVVRASQPPCRPLTGPRPFPTPAAHALASSMQRHALADGGGGERQPARARHREQEARDRGDCGLRAARPGETVLGRHG